MIDDQPHTIIGILAPTFAVPFMDAQILTPLYANPEPQPRAPPLSVQAVAELAPGATIAQVREELASFNRQLAKEYPRTHTGWLLGVESAREWQYGSMRAPLLMLMAAAAFVLLIACVNIANLNSAQAIARSGELALRLALGATRGDVLRMHLAELLIVCVSGLIPGLLLASAAAPALLAINPTVARTVGAVEIDWRVQLFSVVVAMLTAVGASAVPAIRAMRGQMSGAISASASRTTGSPRAVRLQRTLVSIEVALCVALLMAGAVVVQGLRDLSQRSPGYQSAGVLTAQIRLPDAAYKAPELRAAVVARMLDRDPCAAGRDRREHDAEQLRAGVLVSNAGATSKTGRRRIANRTRCSSGASAPDYFKTMQIKVTRGRSFVESDVADQPQVAIVSRQFAERLLPAGDPVGQILLRNILNPPPVTVVGVVDDVFDVSVTQAPEPTLYLPWAQNNNSNVPVAFVIRTAVDPASIAPAVRGVLKEIDGTLPLRRVQADGRIRDGIDRSRAFSHDGPWHHRDPRSRSRRRRHLRRHLSRCDRSHEGVCRAAGSRIAARRRREAGAVGVRPRSGARRGDRARRRCGALRGARADRWRTSARSTP